jgi:hypothetical protein
MARLNLYAAWIGILLGFASGSIHGIFFHGDAWLGGYASWTRRMTRLGHISFLGLAFINLAYVVSLHIEGVADPGQVTSILFLVGAVTMPLVCYLSAFRKPLRHLFAVPVVSLVAGTVLFITRGLLT